MQSASGARAASGSAARSSEFAATCDEMGVDLWVPPIALCTDNAAMIAAAARFTVPLEYPSYLSLDASARVA